MSDLTTTEAPNERGTGFVEYLEEHLSRNDWTVYQFCERSGLAPSVVFRWRKGFRPNIGNARLMADALHVPLLEVLVKAGQLSQEEAGARVEIRPKLKEVPIDALLREISLRFKEQEVELNRTLGLLEAPTESDHEDEETTVE